MNDPLSGTNYYDVFGVAQNATPEAIRVRYRQLMQTEGNHPDLGGNTETAALINKAYAVLSNPAERIEYDARLTLLEQIAARLADEMSNSQAAFRPLSPAKECAFCETPHGCTMNDDSESHCSTCRSPLQPVEHHRLERWDQRAIARIPKNLPVRFFTDWRQSGGQIGRTEDLSLNGLCLVSDAPVHAGQRIRLVTDILDAVGYVVRCLPRRTGWKTEHVAGITFVTLRMLRTAGGFVSDHA